MRIWVLGVCRAAWVRLWRSGRRRAPPGRACRRRTAFPRELNSATASSSRRSSVTLPSSRAPTVMRSGSLPGEPTVPSSGPSLPAAVTTVTPLVPEPLKGPGQRIECRRKGVLRGQAEVDDIRLVLRPRSQDPAGPCTTTWRRSWSPPSRRGASLLGRRPGYRSVASDDAREEGAVAEAVALADALDGQVLDIREGRERRRRRCPPGRRSRLRRLRESRSGRRWSRGRWGSTAVVQVCVPLTFIGVSGISAEPAGAPTPFGSSTSRESDNSRVASTRPPSAPTVSASCVRLAPSVSVSRTVRPDPCAPAGTGMARRDRAAIAAAIRVGTAPRVRFAVVLMVLSSLGCPRPMSDRSRPPMNPPRPIWL